LNPSIQPYVQFPSRVSHMFATHVSQRDSQLKPYVPVAHSEKKIMHIVTQVYILIIKSAIRQSNVLYYLITGEMCLID
jgi:hypothetical protein